MKTMKKTILFLFVILSLADFSEAQNKMSTGQIYTWPGTDIDHPVFVELVDSVNVLEFTLRSISATYATLDTVYVRGRWSNVEININQINAVSIRVIISSDDGIPPGYYDNDLIFRARRVSSGTSCNQVFIENVIMGNLSDDDLSTQGSSQSICFNSSTNYRPTLSHSPQGESIKLTVNSPILPQFPYFEFLRYDDVLDQFIVLHRSSSNTYNDETVEPGVSYQYMARMKWNATSEQYLYTNRITRQSLPELPGLVTYFVGESNSPTTIDLEILKPEGAEVTRYDLSYGTEITNLSQGVSNISANSSSDTTKYELTGLSGNQIYYLQVSAENDRGNGENSEIIDIKTLPGVPSIPASLSVSALNDEAFYGTFNDNSDNEDGFLLQRKLAAESQFVVIDTLQPNVTQFIDKGLDYSTFYTYGISAFNEGGISSRIGSGNQSTRPIEFTLSNTNEFSDHQTVYVHILSKQATLLDSVRGMNHSIKIPLSEAEAMEVIPHDDFFGNAFDLSFEHTNDTLSYSIRATSNADFNPFSRVDTLVTIRLRKAVDYLSGTINLEAVPITLSYRTFSIDSRCDDGTITVTEREDDEFKRFEVWRYNPGTSTKTSFENIGAGLNVYGLDDSFIRQSYSVALSPDGVYPVAGRYKGVEFERISLIPYTDTRFRGSYEVALIEQYVQKGGSLSLLEQAAFDVNMDGEITLADAVLLYDYIKGFAKITDWKFYFANASESIVTDNKFFLDDDYESTQEVWAIFNGDTDFDPATNVNARTASEEFAMIFEVRDDRYVDVYLSRAIEDLVSLDMNIQLPEALVSVETEVFDDSKFFYDYIDVESLAIIRSRSEVAFPSSSRKLMTLEVEDANEFRLEQLVQVLINSKPVVDFERREREAGFPFPVEEDLIMYPNPVTTTFTIEVPDFVETGITVVLTDLAGKKHISEIYPESPNAAYSIDVSGLQSGVYTIVVSDEEGWQWKSKIIKG